MTQCTWPADSSFVGENEQLLAMNPGLLMQLAHRRGS
jgi:hypothetical protein